MKYVIMFLAIVFFLGFTNTSVFAQMEEEQGHIFVITTWKTVMPEGGSEAERDSLAKELFDAHKSNPKVLSQMTMHHYWGHDSRDYVVITEYASMADIDAAGKINQELRKKKWPDDKKRAAFWKAIGKYFDYHADEIYMGMPQLRK
jgi:hypothetical protein